MDLDLSYITYEVQYHEDALCRRRIIDSLVYGIHTVHERDTLSAMISTSDVFCVLRSVPSAETEREDWTTLRVLKPIGGGGVSVKGTCDYCCRRG